MQARDNSLDELEAAGALCCWSSVILIRAGHLHVTMSLRLSFPPWAWWSLSTSASYSKAACNQHSLQLFQSEQPPSTMPLKDDRTSRPPATEPIVSNRSTSSKTRRHAEAAPQGSPRLLEISRQCSFWPWPVTCDRTLEGLQVLSGNWQSFSKTMHDGGCHN